MTEKQIHRAVSDDGTEIVGSVQGNGPPLVFVHRAMDDGTLQWSSSVTMMKSLLSMPPAPSKSWGLTSPLN